MKQEGPLLADTKEQKARVTETGKANSQGKTGHKKTRHGPKPVAGIKRKFIMVTFIYIGFSRDKFNPARQLPCAPSSPRCRHITVFYQQKPASTGNMLVTACISSFRFFLKNTPNSYEKNTMSAPRQG